MSVNKFLLLCVIFCTDAYRRDYDVDLAAEGDNGNIFLLL